MNYEVEILETALSFIQTLSAKMQNKALRAVGLNVLDINFMSLNQKQFRMPKDLRNCGYNSAEIFVVYFISIIREKYTSLHRGI